MQHAYIICIESGPLVMGHQAGAISTFNAKIMNFQNNFVINFVSNMIEYINKENDDNYDIIYSECKQNKILELE